MALDGTKISMGIVGGGKGGYELLKLMSSSQQVGVLFVVDLDQQAPAMELARNLGIRTMSNMEEALRSYPVNYIVEATGSPRVMEMIMDHMPGGSEIISSKAALLFFNIIEESKEMASRHMFEDIRGVQSEITNSVSVAQQALGGIKKVARDLKLLSLNARVESARAGEFGKGFSIVAEKVKETASIAQSLAEDVEKVNQEILTTSNRIDAALEKRQA